MKIFGNHEKQIVELTVSNRTVVRVLLLVVLTMLGLAVLQQAQKALVLIFISLFLAIALNAPVHAISQQLPGRLRGSRSLATSLSFLFIIIVLSAFLISVIPPTVRQTTNFINSAPQMIQDLKSQNSSTAEFIEKYDLETQAADLSKELAGKVKDVSGAAFNALSQIGSGLFAILTVLAMTFMMLIEGPMWTARFKAFVPKHKAKDAEEVTSKMYKVIKGYVNGQVTLAFIASVLVLPMLLILDISNPFALMFVVFVCGLIPMIGHTIGAIIVTLVALTHSPLSALVILAYYILYQQIENYVVQPRIQANSTDLSPLLVFISVVIGVSFNGLLGGLVAIPVMGCLKVLFTYWLKQRDSALAASNK